MKLTRPLGITVIAAAYVLSPLGNILQAAFFANRDLSVIVEHAVRGFGLFGAILIAAAPVVGVGIYSGRKWGIVLFLVHAIGMLANNGVMLSKGKHPHIAILIAVDLAVFAAVAFVLQKDMRAPYLDKNPRGWRLKKRVPCRLTAAITLGEKVVAGTTINLSRTGVLVSCPPGGFTAGGSATVSLKTSAGLELSRPVTVIRVEKDAVAFAFANADDQVADARVLELLAEVAKV